MSRQSISSEMTETLGQVPSYFNGLPDDAIEAEWELFKRFELGESAIPAKYQRR